MTVEALLQPRYKVIADYPNNPIKVGEIIPTSGIIVYADNYDDYPHLFRKLEWWEERSFEYIQHVKNKENESEIFMVINRATHTASDILVTNGKHSFWTSLYDMLPATLAEYTNYLTTKPN